MLLKVDLVLVERLLVLERLLMVDLPLVAG